MDVKEAMAKAKTYFADAFAGEELWGIELEEVAFDYDRDVWRITVGFQLPWNAPPPGRGTTQTDARRYRSRRTLRIDDASGALLDMTYPMIGSPGEPLSVAGPPPRPVLD